MPSKVAKYDVSEEETDSFAEPDSDGYWPIERIIQEKGKKFLVKWKGVDKASGKPWPNDWVNKTDCSESLIQGWEKEKADKKRKRQSRSSVGGRRKSASVSLPPPPPARSRLSTVTPKHKTKSSVTFSPVKERSFIEIDSDEDQSKSDDEPVVGPSSRKRRKVEVNGRAVAQHVTYTSTAKMKGKQVVKGRKRGGTDSESEQDEEPVPPTKQKVQRSAPPIFGPKSAQDRAKWKRQSVGSLQSPGSPMRGPRPSKISGRPMARMSVSTKPTRDSDSEDDEKEEGSDEEVQRAAPADSSRIQRGHRASSRATAVDERVSPSKPGAVIESPPSIKIKIRKEKLDAVSRNPKSNEAKQKEPETETTIGFEALRSKTVVSVLPRLNGQTRRQRSKSPRDALRRLSETRGALPPTIVKPGKPSTKRPDDADQDQEHDERRDQAPEELVISDHASEPNWDDEEIVQVPPPEPQQERQETRDASGDRRSAKARHQPQSDDDGYDPLASTPAPEPLDVDDEEDVDPLAKDPTPPPAAPAEPSTANRPFLSSQELPSQGTNTSKGTIIPDSQPERASQSSSQKSARSQSHPGPSAQPKEPLSAPLARSNSHQERPVVAANETENAVPPRLDFAAVLKQSKGPNPPSKALLLTGREGPGTKPSSKKPLGPVPNLSPSVFRTIASNAAAQLEDIDDIVDSSIPSSNPKPSVNGIVTTRRDGTPSQESEQTDFSGQRVRERDWAAVGLKEPVGPEKKRIAFDAFIKQSASVPANALEPVVEQPEPESTQDEQPLVELPEKEDLSAQLVAQQTAEIAELKAKVVELQSNVSRLEAENSSLVEAELSARAQVEYVRNQYEQVSSRAAEIAIENQTLEKEKRKLDKENVRLSEQTKTAVASVRMALQAELKASKEECQRKTHIADTLLHQARRTGTRLPADDGTEIEVSADEVRRRAADWWHVKRQRDEFEAALAEKTTESEHRETVLSMLRDEEQEKKKKAIRKCKDLEARLAELQSKVEDLEQENQKQKRKAIDDNDDVFICQWVLQSENGEPEKRCREVLDSREACETHVLKTHVLEVPLPETAPPPLSSDPSNGQIISTHELQFTIYKTNTPA